MHAVIVDVSMSDMEQAQRQLHERTVPAVSQAPGFARTGKGHSVVVFDSEEAASAMAQWVRTNAPQAVTVDSISVAEVVAHA